MSSAVRQSCDEIRIAILSLLGGLRMKVAAKSYFTGKANPKEGWKFLECNNEELWDVFKFLTPLVSPMKLARITGKFATTVVECLLYSKQVSWVQVLADLLAQQVKLMGPKNLKVCLSGYLASIYSAKKVLIWREVQDCRYTREGGDPDAKETKEEEEESATETDSDPETDPEPTPEMSSEEQEAEPPSGDKNQTREEPTRSPPPDKPEVRNQARSVEKGQEADQSQGLAHSTPGEPAGGQEAQGESTPDPNLSLDAEWHTLQAQGQLLMNGLGLEMTPAQQAGLISGLAGALQQELTWRDWDWERMGKLLNCFPSSISSGVMKLVQEKEGLASQIQEVEEKRISLERDYREAEHELAYFRSEVGLHAQQVDKVKRERNELQGLSRR
jgi:hypothetical protein